MKNLDWYFCKFWMKHFNGIFIRPLGLILFCLYKLLSILLLLHKKKFKNDLGLCKWKRNFTTKKMKSINARMNYLHIPMRSMCSQCHSSTEFFFLFWYRKNFVNNFSIYEMQISEGFLRIDLKRLFRYLKPPHAISNKKYLTVLFVSISIEGLHRNISVN